MQHADESEQVKGKAFYARTSIKVSDPRIWDRVDAWLAQRERAALRAGRRPPRYSELKTAQRLLAHGMVELEIVQKLAQDLWVSHDTALERASSKKLTAFEMPERDRARLAQPFATMLLDAQQEQRANEALAATAAAERRAAEAEAQLAHRVAAELAQQAKEEAELRERRIVQEAESVARAEAQRVLEETPEWQAEKQRRKDREDLDAVILVLALVMDRPPAADRRETAVRRFAGEQVRRSQWEDRSGHLSDAEFERGPGADSLAGPDASDDELWLAAAYVVELETDDPDWRLRVLDESCAARRTLQSAATSVRAAESHAATGDPLGFEQALSLRREYARYPSDLVKLPAVRQDIKASWRAQLTNAAVPAAA